ncbi:hypothetical protein [Leptospira noguchii]|uniref:hypothetical protein n=1 Tax=Leptospira noguchii TaxID=28182 RepID=UPI0007743200|nr:hypothetical protein [Leptospira noguchii]
MKIYYILIFLLIFNCSSNSYQVFGPLFNKEEKYQCINPNVKIESIQFNDDTYSKNEQEYFSAEFKREIINFIKQSCSNNKKRNEEKENSLYIEISRFRVNKKERFFIINVLSLFILDFIFKNSFRYEYDIALNYNWKNSSGSRGVSSFVYSKTMDVSLFEIDNPNKKNVFSDVRSEYTNLMINIILDKK